MNEGSFVSVSEILFVSISKERDVSAVTDEQ